MREENREQLHGRYLNHICGSAVTFDLDLRQRLIASELGVAIPICQGTGPLSNRLLQESGLRYIVTVVDRISPSSVAVEWSAVEFPSIRNRGVIFSKVDINTWRKSSEQRAG